MQACNEQSSKLFFAYVTSIPGSIRQLHNSQEELVSTDKEILDVCTDFYENLFTDEHIKDTDEAVTDDSFSSIESSSEDTPYAFIPDDVSMHLTHKEHDLLKEEISYEELRQSILKMKKGKAPGVDGLSVDFLPGVI